MTSFDLIVIGAGPGGYEAAALGAAQGQRVLLVERDHLGGTCLNRGCIPTKTLCRTAQVALDVAEASRFGIDLPGAPTVNMAAVTARKDAVVEQLREAVASVVSGCTLLRGTACFTAPHEVEVEGERYTAPKIIVATGSQSAFLPVEGADLAVTSTEMLNLTELPPSLAVIGGGVIGMEFASIFSALGSRVSVIEYCREILPAFDRDVAKTLRTSMKKRGVEFHTGTPVTALHRTPEGTVRVEFEEKGKAASVEAHTVLMAVGRRPVVPEGLAEAGAVIGKRGIEVDADFQTAIPGVYAIGDCNGICLLAHAASAQASRVMGHDIELATVPSAVFTIPECAMVGLTADAAEAASIPHRTARGSFRSNGKALAMGETDGIIKSVIAPDDTLLGLQIVGPHAADLIGAPTLLLTASLPLGSLRRTIHPHPTLAEALLPALR